MRKLKNSHKILSLVLLGMLFISIIILPNSTIVSENKVNDNTSILSSEQTDQSLDTTPPQVSAPAPKYNQTFNIAHSEDDASSLGTSGPGVTPYTDANMSIGLLPKSIPTFSWGVALRWDITVPKYAHITKAYINLTIANLTVYKSAGGPPFNGFNTSISAFNELSTNDFSNTIENLWNRPLVGDYNWELNGTELLYQTIKTVDIKDLLEQIMALNGWAGIFGVLIRAGEGTDPFEGISFRAYDSGKPEYYPRLFIEWEGIPTFIDTPEDKYFYENNPGHSLKWQVWDNNPDIFKVECNFSSIPSHYDKWTSGWVTYDLPPLDRGFYNFTAYFNDTDGQLIWDSVIVEAGPPKPIISSGTYKIERSEDDAWYKPVEGSAFAESATTLELGGAYSGMLPELRMICLRFNTAIPKHAHIKSAYVNLTVESVSGSPYNGFESSIHYFVPPVADFTDDTDVFTNNPYWLETRPSNKYWILEYPPEMAQYLHWDLEGSLSQNNTIQTPNMTSYLQDIIDFPSFDGDIGFFIMPSGGLGPDEKLKTYSYEGAIGAGKTQYTPTLFVEWEESPYFVSTPADILAKNGTRGYYLEWTTTDDNPATFTITCNNTVSNIPPGSTIYSGVWQSGVKSRHNWFYDVVIVGIFKIETITTKIRYDLPPLDIGVYNFTIRINDTDSYYNLDSVIITVSDLDLPVIDIELIQNGKEVNYFQCGNGPFTVRFYNRTSIIKHPVIQLTANYPEFYQDIYSTSISGGDQPLVVFIALTGDTYETEIYSSFNYNKVLGCHEFTCPSSGHYMWKMILWNNILKGSLQNPIFKRINDIEYNILNRIEISVNYGGEYIYNQTIYGGRWARPIKEVWNKDLTPPIYAAPEFIEPDGPDKHYEVNIWADTEAYGAEIDEVILFYSVDDGPWEETEMILKDGKYYGEIPAQEEGVTIDYYIKITDIAGNIIETEEYHEKAPTFEEPSIIIPIVGILLGILGALSIVAIYHHRNKTALKKLRSEISPKKSKKDTKLGNKLLQKIKKVRKKQ